jgi:hypothetical protein
MVKANISKEDTMPDYMTNFTADDMPGESEAPKPTEDKPKAAVKPAPKAVETKVETPKKAPAKKTVEKAKDETPKTSDSKPVEDADKAND